MKYLLNGAEVEVLATTPEGIVVCNIFEAEDGTFTDYQNPYVVDKVYDAVPKEKLNAEVAAIQERIKELSAERNNLSGDVRDLEAQMATRKKAIQQHEQLKFLEDYIAGKITHYVEVCGYDTPKIVEFSKEFCNASNQYDRPRALKLLTLFGDSQGNLSWRLNRYSDGSGSGGTDVFPARSMEEAVEFIKDYITKQAAETVERPRDWVVSTAEKYSIPLPEGYINKFNANAAESILKTISESKDQIAKRESELLKYLPK